MLYQSNRMHDAVVSKLIAASRGSPCDSVASCIFHYISSLTQRVPADWRSLAAITVLDAFVLTFLRFLIARSQQCKTSVIFVASFEAFLDCETSSLSRFRIKPHNVV